MGNHYRTNQLLAIGRRLGPAALLLAGFTSAQAQDAGVITVQTLGKLATPASLPHTVVAAIRNTGTTALTNQTVTLAVTGANTFTSTKIIATLAVGATSLVSFDPYPATLALGTNTLTVSVPTDTNPANNSLTYAQQVTANHITQIDATQPYNATGVGVSSTAAGGALATKFTSSQTTTTLNEARVTFINVGTAGTLYQIQVFDASGAGGLPGATALYTSATLTRPTIAAAGLTATATVALPAVAVGGTYYLAVREVGTAGGGAANLNLAYQVEDPLRPATSYYQVGATGAWTGVETTTLRTRLAIEVGVGAVPTCAYPTDVAVSGITTTSASISFTAPTNGTSYSLIYGPYGFNPTAAGTTVTGSPTTITGLTPNTRYQVYLRANCGTTAGLSVLSDQVTFQTLPTCQAPTAVAVGTITATGATVTFSGPTNSTGYTYWVLPRGSAAPTTGGTAATASPITLTGLTGGLNYDFYLRANCSATDRSSLAGPVSFSTTCGTTAPIISAFPYSEGFDGVAVGALPCGLVVADVNADTKTWGVVADATGSAPNAMRYTYSQTAAADDWFFTPGLSLQPGSRYQLQFKYRAGLATFPEGLEVKYGTAATPAGQTNTLYTNANISNVTYTTVGAGGVAVITPTTAGTYYIGFHATSIADEFYLYVDDVLVTQTIITSTKSPELDRAISVYPNPSHGVFSLDVHGIAAKATAMQVSITNLLGQQVHTTTVKNESNNQLDLSKLAAGIYTLKVQNGDEFMLRKLVIN
jgi:hypothetical protein